MAVAGTEKLTLAMESNEAMAKKPAVRTATPPMTRGLRTILESIRISEHRPNFSTSGSRFMPAVLSTSPNVLHIEVSATSLHWIAIMAILPDGAWCDPESFLRGARRRRSAEFPSSADRKYAHSARNAQQEQSARKRWLSQAKRS